VVRGSPCLAQAACRDTVAPDPQHILTLAASLFRLGRSREALTELQQVQRMLGEAGFRAIPAAAAFRAMTHVQLGETDHARSWYNQFVVHRFSSAHRRNPVVMRLFREVEAQFR
jgi:hypothetical protein